MQMFYPSIYICIYIYMYIDIYRHISTYIDIYAYVIICTHCVGIHHRRLCTLPTQQAQGHRKERTHLAGLVSCCRRKKQQKASSEAKIKVIRCCRCDWHWFPYWYLDHKMSRDGVIEHHRIKILDHPFWVWWFVNCTLWVLMIIAKGCQMMSASALSISWPRNHA